MKHQQAAGHHQQDKPAPKSAARSSAKGKPALATDGANGEGNDNGRYDMIRETAYGIYVARGCVAGHELEDWLQAEEEVNGSRTGSSQASGSSSPASQAA